MTEEYGMKREYYEDIGYKPFLFFVIFGVSANELKVSREKHHVDGFPEDLEIHSLSRPDHADYMDGFFGGDLGKVLKEADGELFETCRRAESCVIIRGTVKEDRTLDYMRDAIGIIEALVEQGAAGVLDFQTFTLYAPGKWTERFFEKEINARNHAVVLVSEEEDGYWLHTRGMLEFGRPDVGIHGVPEEKVRSYGQLVDQMIFYGGKGVFFKEKTRLHTFGGKAYVVKADYVDDFDNFDYNNAYYDVTVLEESEEER